MTSFWYQYAFSSSFLRLLFDISIAAGLDAWQLHVRRQNMLQYLTYHLWSSIRMDPVMCIVNNFLGYFVAYVSRFFSCKSLSLHQFLLDILQLLLLDLRFEIFLFSLEIVQVSGMRDGSGLQPGQCILRIIMFVRHQVHAYSLLSHNTSKIRARQCRVGPLVFGNHRLFADVLILFYSRDTSVEGRSVCWWWKLPRGGQG